MKIQGVEINLEKLKNLQSIFGILKNPEAKKILAFIEANPGACNREVSKILATTEQNCRYHLNKMKECGVLEIDLNERKGKNDIPYKLNRAVITKSKRIAAIVSGKEVSFSLAYSIVRSLQSKKRCKAVNMIEGKDVSMFALNLTGNQNTNYFGMFRKVGILTEKWERKRLLLTVNKDKLRNIFS